MVCKRCKQDKSDDSFLKDKRIKSGRRGTCRQCNNELMRVWRKKNPERCKEIEKAKWERNKHKYMPKNRAYYQSHRDEVLAQKKWYHINVRRPRFGMKTRSQYLKDVKISKEEAKRRRKVARQFKEKNDPVYVLVKNLRRRMLLAIKGQKGRKESTTFEYLGCSREEVVKYIESQFKPGMTWENHGIRGWHVDHIRPCCSFDLATEEGRRKCFHYTNLQPLWAKDNMGKGGRT